MSWPRSRALRGLFLLCLVFVVGGASIGAGAQSRKVDVELIANMASIVPGKNFEVGLKQKITPKWHTYWKNPGDSGEPTRIEWQLPPGFSASEIAWPVPEAIPVGPLTNYGYSDEVLLPVVITPPETLAVPSVTLTGRASWLVCEEICIPEEATVSITLAVSGRGSPVQRSKDADLFDYARRLRPVALPWPVSLKAAEDLELRIDATGIDPSRVEHVQFFPEKWGAVDHAADQRAEWRDGGLILQLKRGELARSGSVPQLAGVLVISELSGGERIRNAFQLTALPSGGAEVGSGAGGRPPLASKQGGAQPDALTGITFWQAILFAVFGGIILNAMPCVLPILSLKVMSLTQHGGASASRHGLA